MFSVVIPAYNCEKTIWKVLESVVVQTRYDLIEEIILINDGSTDKTDKVIKEYIKNNPHINIQYVSRINKGVSYTRNEGIKKAKAEWIALLDADDIWLPNKMETQKKIIDSISDICFLGADSSVRLFKKSREKKVYKISPRRLCIRSVPPTPSVVFNKNMALKLGLFDETRSYSEDIQFFQKFLLVDSYYVYSEDLVNIGFNKSFFAQEGLTSNLKKMHQGRNDNVKELYQMKLISKSYMFLMLLLNEFKFFRRILIRLLYTGR